MFELDFYEVEISKVREEINKIDTIIIDFIFAISQKVKCKLEGNDFIFLNASKERLEGDNFIFNPLNNGRSIYTYEKLEKELYESDILKKILEILEKEKIDDFLEKGLRSALSKRLKMSREVAEIKMKYNEEILDIERRDAMIKNRGEQGEQYSLQEKLAKIFRYIHDKSCELQGICFWLKDHSYDTNELREKLKEN